ncbi:hypothetical protein Kisp01_12240 [Kineosporia sp. NBRC 101677]|nr:hypothetical protein Kisp01_12240 [Kineosporia sp. NBRC 101677]
MDSVTANEVDSALSARTTDVGDLLLSVREDQWFDRKSRKTSPKELSPALVAFANAEGGTIVIGLHNGMVEGMRRFADRENDLRQTPIDYTSPPVRVEFSRVACINAEDERDYLLVLRIDPSESVHETQNGDCYLRIGDESRRLNFGQRQELVYDKGQSQFDGSPVSASLTDLDKSLLQNYRARGGFTTSDRKMLAARSLLTPAGDLTVAGYLLFGEHPQTLFPSAYIRILRFLTPERGTGARLGVEEGNDVRIEGAIPWAVQQATKEIEARIPVRRALGENGLFEARPIVPRDA